MNTVKLHHDNAKHNTISHTVQQWPLEVADMKINIYTECTVLIAWRHCILSHMKSQYIVSKIYVDQRYLMNM